MTDNACLGALPQDERLVSRRTRRTCEHAAPEPEAPEAAARRLEHLLVPSLADWCVLNLLDEDGEPRRTHILAADAELEARLRAYDARYPLELTPQHPLLDVIDSGEPMLAERIDDALVRRFARDEAHVEAMRTVGAHTAMAVPLVSRGRILGAVQVCRNAGSPQPYTPGDLVFLEDAARLAAFALDNARLRQEADTARETLQEMRKALETHGRMATMGSLVAGVGHEIRTPLTVASNHIALASHRLETAPPEARELAADVAPHLAGAQAELDRINAHVTQLRRFTRMDEEPRTEVSLDAAAADAIALFRMTRPGPVELRADLKPTPTVNVRLTQVHQAILHLLENAADAVTPFGGSIHIATGCSEAGEACVEVADDGPGIPQEVEARMYEPLVTTKPNGTGLGLAIVRRVAEEHRARIKHETELTLGTRFVMAFDAAGKD